MASIVRSAKPSSDWNSRDLDAYNISVREETADVFFEGPLAPYSGPRDLVHQDRVVGLDETSWSILQHLRDASMDPECTEGQKSLATDFVAAILRAWDYDVHPTFIRTGKGIRSLMCGQMVIAQTDVCLIDAESYRHLLLVQEDKSRITQTPFDPEAKLIADAIAVFQHNNKMRVDHLFVDAVESEVIYGITMEGSFPRFYQIEVTSELDRCIRHGQYPVNKTVVRRHTPQVPNPDQGMKPLATRELALRCFTAFRKFVLSA